MLFPYIYVAHKVDDYQEYVRFLVKEVWAKADAPFSSEMLRDGQDDKLYHYYVRNHHLEKGRAYDFNLGIETIYAFCAELKRSDPDFMDRFEEAYKINNNIAGLCVDPELPPLTYDEVAEHHSKLAKALKKFCSSLYGGGSAFNTTHFDDFDRTHTAAHYRAFMVINKKGMCPFCGIHRIKGQFDGPRDAYDHYFPKSVYPFNSISFRNLVPMCDECNESYKRALEPIFTDSKNRSESRCKAYYPFDDELRMPAFSIGIAHGDYETLQHDEITLTVEDPDRPQEVASWLRLFNLDLRYRLLLTEEAFGTDWIENIFEAHLLDERELVDGELSGEDLSGLQYCEKEIRLAQRKPWAHQKFLKGPLLIAYRDAGVFEALVHA